MTDTHDDIRGAVREGFKDVFADSTFLEHFIDPRIRSVVVDEMTGKIDKTFGVDCTDHEERRQTHQDMRWVRKTREWHESEEGVAALVTFKKLMKVADFAASGAVKGVVYFIVIGAAALLVLGVAMHKNAKQFMGW